MPQRKRAKLGASRAIHKAILMGFVAQFSSCEFGVSKGVSKGVYAGLNLALHTGDDASVVAQNEAILKEHLGARKLVFMEQIHSDAVYTLKDERELVWRNEHSYKIKVPCDALITSLKGIALCVMVADCAPIIILDEQNAKIAVVHAGRAGVCAKILSKCAQAMSARPSELKVLVGPHIKASCYEIGALDLGDFNRYKKGGFFDISAALEDEIKALNIKNYEISGVCTHCDASFYSYRRDGVCGRQVGAAMIL